MPVTIDLPTDVEQDLRGRINNFDHETKVAALIELYRQLRLSHHQLSSALGLNRFETDELLKRHNVVEDLPTAEEVQREVESILRNGKQ